MNFDLRKVRVTQIFGIGMKVKVQLFGTLGEKYPGHNREEGMEVEIPGGSRVKDLLRHLKIAALEGGIVTAEGRVMGLEDELKENSRVQIFQSIFGG
ncbi:MAG: MoaD/ThiS family protein [Deltaproteobacteria bacterium]|nr:MoaD/ThiS family protein [Deltaproteobacteria bacterium]